MLAAISNMNQNCKKANIGTVKKIFNKYKNKNSFLYNTLIQAFNA